MHMHWTDSELRTGRMRRKIEKPRILLLDCPLEYKKMENQANVEMQKEEDWSGKRLMFKVQTAFCCQGCIAED